MKIHERPRRQPHLTRAIQSDLFHSARVHYGPSAASVEKHELIAALLNLDMNGSYVGIALNAHVRGWIAADRDDVFVEMVGLPPAATTNNLEFDSRARRHTVLSVSLSFTN